MKAYCLSMLFLLFCGFADILCAIPQYEKAAQAVHLRREEPSLKLTTSIIDQKYCKGDTELDGARMYLRLRFANTGKQPLILYKGSSNISRLMISRNEEDAKVRRFEVEASLTQVTSGSRINVKGSSPGKMFVILQPDESFETRTVAGVFVSRDESRQISGAVKAGEHVLQIEIPTWPGSDDLAVKLRQRWRRNGYLWYVPVISEPMVFRIPEQRKLEACP